MLLVSRCPRYETWKGREAQMAFLAPFFSRYKELFVNRFVKEVRQYGKLPGVKVKVVLPLVLQIYRHLVDFSSPTSETVIGNIRKLKSLDVEPDRVMQKIFVTLLMRYIDDYKDDPHLMRHLSLLGDYFDAVLFCLHEAMEETKAERPHGYIPLRSEEIAAMFQDGKRVKLFNIYKGIPIRFEGEVRLGKNGTIQLVVPREKGIVMEWEKRTLMYESEEAPRAVAMRVRRVAFGKGYAVASVDAFARVENFVGRRKSVRVMIDRPIHAKIKAINKQLELEVIDLSARGICLEGSIGSGLPLKESVEVTLPIPQEDGTVRNLRMRGELRYVSQPESLKRRYHIVLFQDPKKEQIIASFVAREEMRILKEIKRMADEKF